MAKLILPLAHLLDADSRQIGHGKHDANVGDVPWYTFLFQLAIAIDSGRCFAGQLNELASDGQSLLRRNYGGTVMGACSVAFICDLACFVCEFNVKEIPWWSAVSCEASPWSIYLRIDV